MLHSKTMSWKKRATVLFALILAATLPVTAFAADATASATSTLPGAMMPSQGQMGGNRGNQQIGMGNTDSTTVLTEEQQVVYNDALALYEGVEDEVLKDLVSDGVIAQQDMDDYISLREAQASMDTLDKSNWTAAQYKDYYEAVQKTGDELTAALQALVDAGQLTQAQADVLASRNTTNLWMKIRQNANTNSAIQTALTTMQQALATFRSTLQNAGITGMGTVYGLGQTGGGRIDMLPDGTNNNRKNNTTRDGTQGQSGSSSQSSGNTQGEQAQSSDTTM